MTVTKADLEAKLREIETIVEETEMASRSAGVLAAVGTGAVVGLSFLLGKRRGRKTRKTRVEVFHVK